MLLSRKRNFKILLNEILSPVPRDCMKVTVNSFRVTRSEPELLVPAITTPLEVKKLSDIDCQHGLRNHLPFLWIYRNNNPNRNPSMQGKDPVKVIREALGRALVHYYPLAGRLVEDPDGMLMVNCNSKGMLFTEANADFMLEELGQPILPPFPFLHEVLYNVPSSDAIGKNCPALLVQVTRLLCGGFVFGARLTHPMWDASGLLQFLNAVAEMAQGAQEPSVPPVWQRELLDARNPPRVTCIHNEFGHGISDIANQLHELYQTETVECSFILNENQIMAIRKHLPPHLADSCTRFELLTACVWKCRTLALNLDPHEEVRVSCVFSGRGKKHGFDLPPGYYGNVIASPVVASEAGDLCEKPLAYAVELLKKATSVMSAEYIRSVADLLVSEKPTLKLKGTFMVSDLTKLKLDELDFGWGRPEFSGSPISLPFFCMYVKHRINAEDVVLLQISLPKSDIDKFQQELNKMTGDDRRGLNTPIQSMLRTN